MICKHRTRVDTILRTCHKHSLEFQTTGTTLGSLGSVHDAHDVIRLNNDTSEDLGEEIFLPNVQPACLQKPL